MSFLDEVRAGLRGALRLFFWDKNAFEDFDLSADGFWRSFSAPIMILPIYYLYLHAAYTFGADLQAAGGQAGNGGLDGRTEFVWTSLAAASINIAVVPLSFIPISRFLEFSDRYSQTIIALNWAQIPILATYFFPIGLYSLHLFTLEMTFVLAMVAFAISSIYMIALVRFATDLNIFVSPLILVIIWLIEFVVEVLIGSVF